MKRNKIFISIASYRDPELIPTIEDCIKNAKLPHNLVFGICRQYHPDDKFDNLKKYKKDKRFKIVDVPHDKAPGVCWARNKIQELYDDEEFHLQLDSHHRFAEHWDHTCKNMIRLLKKDGHKKPLLTGYIPSYNPENDPGERIHVPWKMAFDRFIPEGAVFFIPTSIDEWQGLDRPVPARFFSAHFVFTNGKWIKEVPYDPNYYFHGEEINLAARSFTHGYDLFHTHRVVCWHEYTRKGRTKQWDDAGDWVQVNEKSHLRNRKLFGMDGEKQDVDFKQYGFGKKRTLEDYERYAGIHFKKRAIQQYTIDEKYPPNPQPYKSKKEYEDSYLNIFKHCIDIGYEQVPLDDYDFWCVAFKDEKGEDVYRQDADSGEIINMKRDPDGYCKVWRTFNIDKKPHSWLVWPHSKSKGWAEPITGDL
jgi:hypothetical protein